MRDSALRDGVLGIIKVSLVALEGGGGRKKAVHEDSLTRAQRRIYVHSIAVRKLIFKTKR